MKCPNCGYIIHDNKNFCTKCGAKICTNIDNDIKTKTDIYFKVLKILGGITLISLTLGFYIYMQPESLLKREYKKAVEYCNSKDFRSVGEYINCHYEYLEKKNLGDKYLKIRDFCYTKSSTTYDTSVCVDETINKIIFWVNKDDFENFEINTFKSIIPINDSDIKNLSTRYLLDLMIQQNEDMQDLIDNPNLKQNTTKIFEIFYRNLLKFTSMGKLSYTQIEEEDIYDNNDLKFKQNEDFSVELLTPKTKLFKMVCGEGIYSADINYDYLIKTYAQKLDKEWQDYLKLRQIQRTEINGSDYYYAESSVPSVNILLNWAIDEQRFLNNYPKFVMNDIIKEELNKHLSDACLNYYSKSALLEYHDNENFILSKEGQKAYYKFLTNFGDKNKKEYIEIRQWYETLKLNNFKGIPHP